MTERSDLILLCTIIPNSKYFLEKTVKKIAESFKISNNKIFVLKTQGAEDKFILTYNVIRQDEIKYRDVIRNTFQVHRKKEENVLYTLNALNEAIKNECNGVENKEHVLNWSDYRNNLLLVHKDEKGESKLNKMSTILYEIIDLNQPGNNNH